jgi:MarR family transcriptional regulator, organic hydroperoxide resistance regulator
MYDEELPFGIIVGKMMHDVFKVLKTRTEAGLTEKLSIHQLGLLHSINRNEQDVIQQDMAIRMGKDKSSILRMIDALEEKKLVSRVPDLEDRRKNKLILTEQGHDLIKKFLIIEKEVFDDLNTGITKDELKTFFNVIEKIKDNAQKL